MSNKRQREKRRRWCKAATMKGIFSTVARMYGKDYFNRQPVFPLFSDEVDDARMYRKGFVIPYSGLSANVKPPEDAVMITRHTMSIQHIKEWDRPDLVEAQRLCNQIEERMREQLNRAMMLPYGRLTPQTGCE